MRKLLGIIIALLLVLALVLFLVRNESRPDSITDPSAHTDAPVISVLPTELQVPTSPSSITIGGLDNDLWFTKYGNVNTDCSSEVFLEDLGYCMGDIVTVRFLNQELTLPVVPTYSYVDTGAPAIIVRLDDAGNPTGVVSLAINMGNFGETYGLGSKHTDNDANWWWEAAAGVTFPVAVSFEMAEPAGYHTQYILRSLSRTNLRSDYPGLTDSEFANFREITTTGIPPRKLHRTSSPINPELGRNTYACDLLEAAGVTVIMNLADSPDEAQSYEGFSTSYYAQQQVIYLNMGVDFASPDFKTSLASGLRFFAQNPGIYAVHCTEGKDRAGFVSALLECLMGATCQEVIDDYLVTYYNYYGVEPGTEKARLITESNIHKILCDAFEITDPYQADLAAEAADYIRSIGLSDSEIAQLRHNLSH